MLLFIITANCFGCNADVLTFPCQNDYNEGKIGGMERDRGQPHGGQPVRIDDSLVWRADCDGHFTGRSTGLGPGKAAGTSAGNHPRPGTAVRPLRHRRRAGLLRDLCVEQLRRTAMVEGLRRLGGRHGHLRRHHRRRFGGLGLCAGQKVVLCDASGSGRPLSPAGTGDRALGQFRQSGGPRRTGVESGAAIFPGFGADRRRMVLRDVLLRIRMVLHHRRAAAARRAPALVCPQGRCIFCLCISLRAGAGIGRRNAHRQPVSGNDTRLPGAEPAGGRVRGGAVGLPCPACAPAVARRRAGMRVAGRRDGCRGQRRRRVCGGRGGARGCNGDV